MDRYRKSTKGRKRANTKVLRWEFTCFPGGTGKKSLRWSWASEKSLTGNGSERKLRTIGANVRARTFSLSRLGGLRRE